MYNCGFAPLPPEGKALISPFYLQGFVRHKHKIVSGRICVLHDAITLPYSIQVAKKGHLASHGLSWGELTIDREWRNYHVSPMGANVQLVFYRKAGNDDVLVKILHNEVETTIPIPTDVAPYYHWKDVRAFFMSQL